MTERKRRLAPLRPGALDDAQREVYDAIAGGPRAQGPQAFPLTDADGALRGPFNAMLLSPEVGMAVQAVGAAVRYGSVLPGRTRELAILEVARHWGSDFERAAHEAVGRACGLTEAELRGDLGPDPGEGAVVAAVRELLEEGALSDDAYGRAVGAVGERGVFELTVLVGYYGMLATQLRVFAGEGRP